MTMPDIKITAADAPTAKAMAQLAASRGHRLWLCVLKNGGRQWRTAERPRDIFAMTDVIQARVFTNQGILVALEMWFGGVTARRTHVTVTIAQGRDKRFTLPKPLHG